MAVISTMNIPTPPRIFRAMKACTMGALTGTLEIGAGKVI